MTYALFALGVAAAALSSLRWLRVSQREHYLAGSVSLFAWRWWSLNVINGLLLALALGAVVACFVVDASEVVAGAFVVAAFAVVLGPVGLGLRGSTSPLAWTDRLRRVAIVASIMWLVAAIVGTVFHVGFLALALVAVPVVLDFALLLLAPVERRLGRRWVDDANAKLVEIAPSVVAITGSYGKTTTKAYVLSLLGSHLTTVASPASFNNRMGLARAINEHLAAGTEVFVAEMGTYGPGEIRDLCSWIPPKVAVITAIGPVHLERFGSLEVTLASKAEIFERAEIAVLDDELLNGLLPALDQETVITCSALGSDATVSLAESEAGFFVRVRGEVIAEVGPVAMPSNLACAIGVAVAMGVPLDRLGSIVAESEAPAHRQTVFRGEGGFDIIDDTYNSNPAGVRSALRTLGSLGDGKRVVVTPGMVELGKEQYDENREFGRLAADVASHILVVGHTNRKALREGTKQGSASVIVMASRPDAVSWVKANLGVGDAVLYENDLPDHYA